MKAPAFFTDCRTYRVPLLQCPSFLFLILGGFTVAAMISTYLIASRYTEEPQVATLIVIGVTVLMLVVGQVIVASFRRLAEANVAKSEFVSIASHQLRTPLSAVKWASSLLREPREHGEYLKIIRDNTERMIGLVNALLDVSRIESGTLPLKRETVALEVLSQEIVGQMQPLARASNVTLRSRPPSSLPAVLGDRERLRAAMRNLIDNAIRYTAGTGAVEVRIEADAEKVTWRVQDTGVGISREDKPKIFQKFFRAKSAITHQTVGSGLGLFIARAVLEALGGTIGFTTEEGKGSTFWFTLPIASV